VSAQGSLKGEKNVKISFFENLDQEYCVAKLSAKTDAAKFEGRVAGLLG